MTATIRDIADAAGLSVTTVSHALSGRGRVAPATRERVLGIAGNLGYVANVHAQRLVLGRSRMLAVQVVGFSASADSGPLLLPDDQYFMDILNGALSAAAEQDYQLLLTPYDSEPERLHPMAIDGAMIVDPMGDEPLAKVLTDRGVPIVTTGHPTRGPETFPSVDNDHACIAVQMLEHLVAMGYERPALVAMTPMRSYVADMVQAYERWSGERGAPSIVVEVPEPPNVDAGAAALDQLLARPERPDAVYAAHDRLALGVLLEAQRRSIAVPRELGVASAVDSDAVQLVEPHITAVKLNARQIGHEAARLLIDLVERGREPAECRTLVPSEVIARASTARAGG